MIASHRYGHQRVEMLFARCGKKKKAKKKKELKCLLSYYEDL